MNVELIGLISVTAGLLLPTVPVPFDVIKGVVGVRAIGAHGLVPRTIPGAMSHCRQLTAQQHSCLRLGEAPRPIPSAWNSSRIWPVNLNE